MNCSMEQDPKTVYSIERLATPNALLIETGDDLTLFSLSCKMTYTMFFAQKKKSSNNWTHIFVISGFVLIAYRHHIQKELFKGL